jgi:toxin YoeB
MSYEIQYSDEASKALEKYKKSNPVSYQKVYRLIKELIEHPRVGTGHPKPLASGNDITYSRRISKKNRIIYDIYDDKVIVLIISVEGHYDDK